MVAALPIGALSDQSRRSQKELPHMTLIAYRSLF